MTVSAEERRLLRHEVAALRARESRRVFDTVVNVGRFGGAHESFVAHARDVPVLDAALRTDVVSTLVAELDPELTSLTVWLTRAGEPELRDLDLGWRSAAAVACGEHGRTVDAVFAITRTGWLDVNTGKSQTWKRLRL